MFVCGQHFRKSFLQELQQDIDTDLPVSRTVLSKKICEILNWRTTSGKLQLGSCRKALVKLERLGHLHLPPVSSEYSFKTRSDNLIDIEIPEVCCSLEELGPIELVKVGHRRSNDARVWNTLLERFHYLGKGPLCGACIRYLVKSNRGYIGGLAFNSATYALRKRDEYIGWSEDARHKNLKAVILNSRFLLLPSVCVKNLASYVLSLSLSRVQDDWQQRYNCEPFLVETFVDPTRFNGTCYKASNWIPVGSSSGRRDGISKDIYLYPLISNWRQRLCVAPTITLGEHPGVESVEHWAHEEFGTSRLYDIRLKERLYKIACDFYDRPVTNIPEASGSYAATKGVYRFFSNRKITMDVLLTPHVESTIKRIQRHPVVLAPQDTTILNYSHLSIDGLGPINNSDNSAVGMLLHDTLTFTPQGTPLGIVDAQCWVRDLEDKKKRERRKQLPIEQKESIKWLRSFQKVAQIQNLCPDTMLVSMGDREADVYELFMEADKTPNGPKLLIRADRGRSRKVVATNTDEDGHSYLWAYMKTQPLAGMLQVHLPKREDKNCRDAQVEVRFSPVTLIPPKKSTHKKKISVWAVYLSEPDNTDEDTRIEWMLLTTVPVLTFEDAKERTEWYSGRWGIEVYHRTLKSGCRIKDRQLGTVNSLQACLGVDMVVAWRIYHLTMLGREVPNHPCTVFFEDVEWKALCCYVNKSPIPPDTPPTLKEAIRMVGSIGGHLGRISDGMPGTECIWRGIQRLDTAVDMFIIFTNAGPPAIRQSYTQAMNYNDPSP